MRLRQTRRGPFAVLRRQPVRVRSGTSRNYPGFNAFSLCFLFTRDRRIQLPCPYFVYGGHMSLLDQLSAGDAWQAFYEYKTSLACPKAFAKELREYIDSGAYLPVCGRIAAGEPFPLPRRSVISKLGTDKKRVVYTYPYAENMVLKHLTYLMLRRYDHLFADGLYSFRPGRNAKSAVRMLLHTRGISQMYAYKVDIHDYFNSVPVEAFLPVLQEAVGEDAELCDFLSGLLAEPRVYDRGRAVTDRKGIMAGTPVASFYANLYLRELDEHFASVGVPYARYSDDIIVFDVSRGKAEEHAQYIREFLESRSLTVNPKKENFYEPGEAWTFLGFECRGDAVDIAPATVTKMKQKMRRKSRALMRWRKRNGVSGEKAAAAFIRIFNRKLLESPQDNDLTWSCWFFSMINTAESLREIDAYAQECIRYLVSGTRTKARFNVRYDDLKRLGYRSLVHEYYGFEKPQRFS